jgi:hypothetical protein
LDRHAGCSRNLDLLGGQTTPAQSPSPLTEVTILFTTPKRPSSLTVTPCPSYCRLDIVRGRCSDLGEKWPVRKPSMALLFAFVIP